MLGDARATLREAMKPYWKAFLDLQRTVDRIRDVVFSRPMSITEEIDRIPGRRIFFTFIQVQDFTTSQDGQSGAVMTFTVSQDGPYVQTHYPLAMWKPSLPTNATNFGRWRPVSSWPLPDQVVDADIIDLSYKVEDQGSGGRAFQDGVVPPGLLSRPDCLIPLPVPTLFRPNATIGFTPTYDNILFDASTPPTQGTLVVALPGYKIVNL